MVADYEIAIIGGGPSGLLLASKLAPSRNVLLVERHRVGSTQKFWVSTEMRLSAHNLTESIVYRANRATIGSFWGSTAEAVGDFSIIDSHLMLSTLRERCEALGVQIYEEAPVRRVVPLHDRAEVHHRGGPSTARLVVDATGGGSQIAASLRSHQILGFFSVFAREYSGLELSSDDVVAAHVLRFGNPLPQFELLPTGPNSGLCVMFVASEKVVAPALLEPLLSEHLADNPFVRLRRDSTRGSPKFGLIPIGKPRNSQRRPGFISFGEAALLQSPLLGAAFNEVLDWVESFSGTIAASLDSEGTPTPYWKPPWSKRVNDKIQLLMASKLIDCSLDDFDFLVQQLQRLGSTGAYRLLATRLLATDLLALAPAAWRLL